MMTARVLRWLRAWMVALVLVLTWSPARADDGKSAVATPKDTPPHAGMELQVPPIPSDFAVKDAGWIKFAYPASAHGRVRQLIDVANESREGLSAELDKPVLSSVEVRLARSPAELAMLAPSNAPPPEYAEGVAYASARLIVISLAAPNPSQPPVLPEVLRHELAHIALHDAVGGNRIPRWFNEGFAVHASGESSLVRSRTLWSASVSNRLLPMSEIDRTFPASSTTAAIAYAQSADFVRFLMRRQDRARFSMLVDRVAQGQPFESSLSDAYDADWRRLEYQWRQDVAKRSSWVPILLGGGLFWVGAFVVIGVGWIRRRRDHRRTLARWEREEAEHDRLVALMREEQVRTVHDTAPPETTVVVLQKPTDPVPKVEHDGRWHTVH